MSKPKFREGSSSRSNSFFQFWENADRKLWTYFQKLYDMLTFRSRNGQLGQGRAFKIFWWGTRGRPSRRHPVWVYLFSVNGVHRDSQTASRSFDYPGEHRSKKKKFAIGPPCEGRVQKIDLAKFQNLDKTLHKKFANNPQKSVLSQGLHSVGYR